MCETLTFETIALRFEEITLTQKNNVRLPEGKGIEERAIRKEK